jgi:phosphoketolase
VSPLDAQVLERRQLPDNRPDLFTGESSAERATTPRTYQTAITWALGTSPGLSFIYVHLNRLIQDHDVDMIYLAGPGHGGPALLANVYLEGTYTEVYPQITQDAEGMRRLFRQFSTPGGVPSHVSVPTPGSIHEGGELGYVLTHAFGAAFDNPDLIAVAVVGDGEAETGPLEGSWKCIKFLNPIRDGAVLPILHLNGYKISGPTVLGVTMTSRYARSSPVMATMSTLWKGMIPCTRRSQKRWRPAM